MSREDTTPPCAIAVHVLRVERERSAGGLHADLRGEIADEHHYGMVGTGGQ
jgi:hypothetical protein